MIKWVSFVQLYIQLVGIFFENLYGKIREGVDVGDDNNKVGDWEDVDDDKGEGEEEDVDTCMVSYILMSHMSCHVVICHVVMCHVVST